MRGNSFFWIGFRFAVTAAVGVSTIWLSLGQMVAEKIITAMLMPAGLLWMFLLFSTSYAAAMRERAGAICLFLSWAALSVAGNGYVADAAGRSLEAPFLEIDPFQAEPYDAVVLLGGGGTVGSNGRYQGNWSGDRFILAAQLYHQKKAKLIICTGQKIAEMNSSGVDPSVIGRDVLTQLGVPDDAIEEIGGRNTTEEMKNLGEKFPGAKDRVGLITSAWHLSRALRLAENQNFYPEPLPADFWSGPQNAQRTPGQMIEAMIPSGFAIGANTAFMKEKLAELVGR